MNINLENEIRDALANGSSAENLAKDFADLLNKINKEQEQKNQAETAIANYRHKCLETVREALQTDIWNGEVVGAVSVLAYATPDWTAEDMKQFATDVGRGAGTSAATIKMDPFEGLVYCINQLLKDDEKNKEKGRTIPPRTFRDLENDFKKFVNNL